MNIFRHWFSHETEQYTDESQNPWAGLASYEDPETAKRKLLFCGRDDESYDVAKLILSNIFVTLYGKSGIGKTSLLNAGVFPELREERFTPLSLRLGIRDEETPKSYQSIIIEALGQKVNRIETIDVIHNQTDEESVDYLWNYFARHRFYDKSGERITPVFVFDQFEEVFRTDSKEAEILLRQLDYINDKDHTLDNCTIDGVLYRYETCFRFVVSIREDDLYRLEDCLDNCYLPALKRCRYRLRSLTEQGALDVILTPGKDLFKTDDVSTIAQNIIAKSRNEDGSISTNIISLLCSRIYVDYLHSGSNNITPSLVDSFLKGNPFERFYNEATKGLSFRVRRLLENNLITEDGHRKYIEFNTFESYLKDQGLQNRLLESNTKILQRVHISSQRDVDGVELIHDSFCKAILSMRQKKQNKMLHRFYILLLLLLLFLVGETIYLMYWSSYNNHHRPIKTWTIRINEEGNANGYMWDAEVIIKDKDKDTTYASYRTINSFNWKDSLIRYTPDSTIKNFKVQVILRQNKDQFFPIKDTIIYVNNTSDSTIFRKIEEIRYDYEFNVFTNVNKDEYSLYNVPVKNATIMLDKDVFYTDAHGICKLRMKKKIQPEDTLLIFRDGYLSEIKKWKQINGLVYIQIRDEILTAAFQERQNRMRKIDTLATTEGLHYTQTLSLKRDDETEDIIYLRAFVDKKQDIFDGDGTRHLEIVKGCYYYQSECPNIENEWEDIPLDKVYLLDGYVDESIQGNIENHCVYFFEGTDLTNNKEQFFGVLNGNAAWKKGQYIVPGNNGLSGIYQSIRTK